MRIWNGKYNVFGGVWGENKVLHEESQSESNFFFFFALATKPPQTSI